MRIATHLSIFEEPANHAGRAMADVRARDALDATAIDQLAAQPKPITEKDWTCCGYHTVDT